MKVAAPIKDPFSRKILVSDYRSNSGNSRGSSKFRVRLYLTFRINYHFRLKFLCREKFVFRVKAPVKVPVLFKVPVPVIVPFLFQIYFPVKFRFRL